MANNAFLQGFMEGFNKAGGTQKLSSYAAKNIAGGKYYDPMQDPMALQEMQRAMQGTPAMKKQYISEYGEYMDYPETTTPEVEKSYNIPGVGSGTITTGGESRTPTQEEKMRYTFGAGAVPEETMYGMGEGNFIQTILNIASKGGQIPENVLSQTKETFGYDISPLIKAVSPQTEGPYPVDYTEEGKKIFQYPNDGALYTRNEQGEKVPYDPEETTTWQDKLKNQPLLEATLEKAMGGNEKAMDFMTGWFREQDVEMPSNLVTPFGGQKTVDIPMLGETTIGEEENIWDVFKTEGEQPFENLTGNYLELKPQQVTNYKNQGYIVTEDPNNAGFYKVKKGLSKKRKYRDFVYNLDKATVPEGKDPEQWIKETLTNKPVVNTYNLGNGVYAYQTGAEKEELPGKKYGYINNREVRDVNGLLEFADNGEMLTPKQVGKVQRVTAPEEDSDIDYSQYGPLELAKLILSDKEVTPEQQSIWEDVGYSIMGTPQQIVSGLGEGKDEINKTMERRRVVKTPDGNQWLSKNTAGFLSYPDRTPFTDQYGNRYEVIKEGGKRYTFEEGKVTVGSGGSKSKIVSTGDYNVFKDQGAGKGYDETFKDIDGREYYMDENFNYRYVDDNTEVPNEKISENKPGPLKKGAQTIMPGGESGYLEEDWFKQLTGAAQSWFNQGGEEKIKGKNRGNVNKAIEDLREMAEEHYNKKITDEALLYVIQKLPEEKKEQIREDKGVSIYAIKSNLTP